MKIQSYSKAELRTLYNVSPDVFNNWLKGIEGIIPNYHRTIKVLTPKQVKVIIEELGDPSE